MSLPSLMQKGLATLLQLFKFAGYEGVNKAIVTLNEHFTLTAYEIAQAYQESYELALQAISFGLGKTVFLPSRILTELAQQVRLHYWQPFIVQHHLSSPLASALSSDIIAQCQILAKRKLFTGETTLLTERELANLITVTDSFTITQLVLEQLQHPDSPTIHLNEKILAFFSYNDLLGVAILFFLHEQLRQERRVESTLAALQRQELWQDVHELKTSLQHMMTRLDYSPPNQPSEELNLVNSIDSLLPQQKSDSQLTGEFSKETFNFQKTEVNQHATVKALPDTVESHSDSTWNKELEELLELARRKYDHPLSSFSSSDTIFAMENQMSDLEEDIYTTCPYCHHFMTITAEGGVECPNCQGGFEVDEDGDVISCYDEEESEE